MAFPTIEYQNKLAVQQFANALYDVQVGSETMDQVLSEIDQYGMDAAFNAYYNASFGSMSDADVATMMVGNLGVDAANTAAAEAYVTAQLAAAPAGEKGAAAYDILELFAGLEDDPVLGADVAAWNAEVDMAMDYSGEADLNVGDVAPFVLTAGIDSLTGTSADDRFDAPLSQNDQAGGVSNTLSSSDELNGGAGDDLLNAVLVSEFFGASGDNQVDVQPEIANIETIQLEAKDDAGNVIFDAKDVTGVDSIGSYFSDGDLVIENLTTLTDAGALRNTEDITITMDHTDNVNSDGDASDLTVYFDEDYLLAGQTTSAAAVGYYLLDEESNDYINEPLLNIERNGVKFILEGVEYTVQMDVAESEAADTWATYAAELQESLAELQDPTNPDYNEELVGLSFVHDTDNTYFGQDATFNDDGVLVSIDPIVLIDELGREIDGSGFISPEDATGNFDIYGTWNNDPATSSDLPVTINVELEKVGRDNNGGDLFVGGKHSEGIPVFNVSVLGDEDKPSNLGVIDTNGSAMDEVYISTADTTLDTFASLTVRDGFGQDSLDLVDADDFLGDLTLGSGEAIEDLETLTAQGGGDVSFDGVVDGSGNAYSYTTANGEDVFDVVLDGDAVDTIGESFSIYTGGADDTVTINGEAGVSQNTMDMLDNLSITTGAGDDTVYINDYQRFDIEAGSGSDFVYINSQGSTGAATGALTFSTATGPATFVDRVLYQAELTVTFAGFESTVAVETDANGNFVADQVTINEAIMAAIDENPELSKLLEYTEGTADQQFTVSSLVDGANQLEIELFQPELVASGATGSQVALNSGDEDALLQGIIATDAAEDSATDPLTYVNGIDGQVDQAGTAGAQFLNATTLGSDALLADNVNFSVINMGDGSNDVVVLDSNDESANRLVIDQSFGKVSVVNYFDDDARTVVGNHLIDYTHYLDNMTDATDNTNDWSANPINVTLNADSTAEANSVTMLSFDATATDSIAWSDLEASDLVAALNGDATDVIGGLTDGDLDAVANTTDLVGNVQNHIVKVENAQNPGEYKVFYLTSTVDSDTNTTDGEFDTGATLLGTLDFGASINFPLWGNATDMAAYETLMDNADAFVDDSTYSVAVAAGLTATGDLSTPYDLSDTAENLVAAAATYLDDATNITATTDATVAQAQVIADATNFGTTTFDVSDAADNIVAAAANTAVTDATAVTATTADLTVAQADTLEGLANLDAASVYTIVDIDVNLTAVADWTSYSNATAVDSTDNSFTLSVTEFADFIATTTSTTGDTITVDGSAATAGITVDGAGQAASLDITGSNLADTLTGGDAADIITGGDAADIITGGAGADNITPGLGNDIIVNADIANEGLDVIASFTTAADGAAIAEGADTLQFSDADLTGITGFVGANTITPGTADPLLTFNDGTTQAEFISGAGAVANEAAATFLFDTSTNTLSFDADGNTGTGVAAIDIVTLTGVADLATADFAFVA